MHQATQEQTRTQDTDPAQQTAAQDPAVHDGQAQTESSGGGAWDRILNFCRSLLAGERDENGAAIECADFVRQNPSTIDDPTEAIESHTIQSGETLGAIAQQYNVEGGYLALAAYNNIGDPDRIFAGQEIRIPPAASTEAPATQSSGSTSGSGTTQSSAQQSTSTEPAAADQGESEQGEQSEDSQPAEQPQPQQETTYTVQSGDSLAAIADRFQVSGGYSALAEHNGIANPEIIHPGQVLRIPVEGSSTPATAAASNPTDASTSQQSDTTSESGASTGQTDQTAAQTDSAGAATGGEVPMPDPSKGLAQQDETVLMAMNLYAEARGEYEDAGEDALYAIAQVVHNRVLIGAWGSSYKDVILAPLQFSWTRSGEPNQDAALNPSNSEIWAICYRVATEVMGGGGSNPVGGADHYHANYVSPSWADESKITATIGVHIFYDLMSRDNYVNEGSGQDSGTSQGDTSEQDQTGQQTESEPGSGSSSGGRRDAPIAGENSWIQSAISYNNSRPYTSEQWYSFQATLGTDPDGRPGKRTARAIYRWQDEHSLETDGKLGPSTKQSITSAGASSAAPQTSPRPEPRPEQQSPEPEPEEESGGALDDREDGDSDFVQTTDDTLNSIQRQHPGGISVVLYGGNGVRDRWGNSGYTRSNNNAEFTTQAEGHAEAHQTVGHDGTQLLMPHAMVANTKTAIEESVNDVYDGVMETYRQSKPEDAPEQPAHLKLKNLSLYYHGIQSKLNLPAAPNEDLSRNNVESFVESISGAVRSDLSVQLYACSAARGENSLAENMADELGGDANVFGHTTAAHTTENHNARVFGALGDGTDLVDILFPDDFVREEMTRIWGENLSEENVARAESVLRQRLERYYGRVIGLTGGWRAAERRGYEEDAQVHAAYYDSQNLAVPGREAFADPDRMSGVMQRRWRDWARQNERGHFASVAPVASSFG